jgi:hypothetical protein
VKKLLSGVTVACLVSLFTVGSVAVAQEDPIFDDILQGNPGNNQGAIAGGISEALVTTAAGGIAGGISEPLITTAAGISEALVTTPNVTGGTGFGGGFFSEEDSVNNDQDNQTVGAPTEDISVPGAGDTDNIVGGAGDGFFSEEGSVNDNQDSLRSQGGLF